MSDSEAMQEFRRAGVEMAQALDEHWERVCEAAQRVVDSGHGNLAEISFAVECVEDFANALDVTSLELRRVGSTWRMHIFKEQEKFAASVMNTIENLGEAKDAA